MALELILTPDLYVPVWADDDDRAFLVLQAALKDPTDADVEVYLKGFSVPTEPGAATAVTVRLVAGGAPPAGDLLPVPLPDATVLTVRPFLARLPPGPPRAEPAARGVRAVAVVPGVRPHEPDLPPRVPPEREAGAGRGLVPRAGVLPVVARDDGPR